MDNDKLQFIREKCIEANPSIKDLVFGVAIEFKYNGEKKIGYYLRPCMCEDNDGDMNDGISVYWDEEESQDWDISVQEYKKVIGRPIRLADVLLAINIIVQKYHYVSVAGKFYEYHQTELPLSMECSWNLKQDDLTSQSPECIDFLFELLHG